MSRTQRTLAKPALIEGTGLHTGASCRVVLSPLPAGSGLRIVRKDLGAEIPVDPFSVASTDRGTCLRGGKGAVVHTIEHLMAALSGLMIDNVLVEMEGEEMPILDGSAKPIALILRGAGIVEQEALVEPIVVRERIDLSCDGVTLIAEPPDDEALTVQVGISFPYPGLENQVFSFKLDGPDRFEEELAPSRTFCFEEEVEFLRSKGLIKGGSLDCALVVGRKGILNGPLRFPDEFVRHKTLDLIGDLRLLNRPLWAKITVAKAGHRWHVELAKAIRTRCGRKNPAPGTGNGGNMLDVNEIQKILPHRYPFLMIDRVLEVEVGKRVVAIKNVTANEPQFQGHFPGNPIMPGVLMVEAIAQAGGIALMNFLNQGKVPFFARIDEARFRQPVRPGDQLRIEVEVTSQKAMIFKMAGKAIVDGQVACETQITCALVPAGGGQGGS